MLPNPEPFFEPHAVAAVSTPASLDPLAQLERVLGEPMAPLIARAREAFRRDLPRLLAEQPRQWVAYSGDQRIGIGPTKTQLYQECLRRGLDAGQFLVLSIEPESPKEVEVPHDV